MLTISHEPAPARWAPYFINGDDSGMTEDDIRAADRWVAWAGGRVVSVGESYWGNYQRHVPGQLVYEFDEVAEYTIHGEAES